MLTQLLASRRRRDASRILVADDFNRADSALSLGTADTGQAWTVHSGTGGISSNRGYFASAGIATIDAGQADVDVSCAFPVTADGHRLVLRFTDTSNYVFAQNGSGTAVALYRMQAGVPNQIASAAYAWAGGEVVRVVARGSAWTVYVDGVSTCTATDSFQSSATRHGIAATTTTPRFDSFRVTVP